MIVLRSRIAVIFGTYLLHYIRGVLQDVGYDTSRLKLTECLNLSTDQLQLPAIHPIVLSESSIPRHWQQCKSLAVVPLPLWNPSFSSSSLLLPYISILLRIVD